MSVNSRQIRSGEYLDMIHYSPTLQYSMDHLGRVWVSGAGTCYRDRDREDDREDDRDRDRDRDRRLRPFRSSCRSR